MPFHLSIHLSIRSSIAPHIYPSIHLSMSIHPSIHMPFHPSIRSYVLATLHPCSDTRGHPLAHPDGSRSRPSRRHRSSAWWSTRGWPLGPGFGRSGGPPGLGSGTAARSPGSLSTSGRRSRSPCGKRSRCSSPALWILPNTGGELQKQTNPLVSHLLLNDMRWILIKQWALRFTNQY